MVQITAVALAFWVALTRVKDHMHHPGDVIGGALIGTGIQVRRKSYKPYPSKHSLYPIFPPQVFNVLFCLRVFQKSDENTCQEKQERKPLLPQSYAEI